MKVRKGTVEEAYDLSMKIPEFVDLRPFSEFRDRLQGNHLILIAEEAHKPIGFKCGYPISSETGVFYSWMGGVLPGFRKHGAATKLLHTMQDWCVKEGFDTLEFKTLNAHRAMLLFGIKQGFDIKEVIHTTKDPRPRIVLQKSLIQA